MAGKQIPNYALTTRERVKDRLGITDNAHDRVLDRFVKQVSDYIQGITNQNFLLQKYTYEMQTIYGKGQRYFMTNFSPIFQLKLIDVSTQAGSPVISNISNTNGAAVGMQVIGDNIQSGTKIVSVGSNTITLNQNCTGTTSSAFILVNGIVSLQYKAGLPSTPNWTDLIPDVFEMLEDGKSGMLKSYAPINFGGYEVNAIRCSYWAGYMIDWENETDPTKHTLPGDLTMLAENLIVRFWTRRKAADKTAEGLQGATVSWDRELTPVDQQLISQYSRFPKFT